MTTTSEAPSENSALRARASFGDAKEAAEFVSMLTKFETGEITSDQYRTYRLSRGIYGQRQEDVSMVRIKIPQGILSSAQLRSLAEISERYSRGYGHVTTRQNVQFHGVTLPNVPAVIKAVADAGLTTREACSHTVRNVTGCAFAGVCGSAPFDATPYAELITRFFLRAPLGSGLPRKFKIAVSGCETDCAEGAINDIGLIARVRDGVRGFKVLAGGGTATFSRSAAVLHEFLPADQILSACEAVLRVYNVEGERKNLQKARMKWAIHRLGWENFRALYQTQLDAVLAEGGRPLGEIPEPESAPESARQHPLAVAEPFQPAYQAWKKVNVRAQSQPGYSAVSVWLRLGDVSTSQFRGLADLVETLGDGTVRTSTNQNLVARWVKNEDLPALWTALETLGLAGAFADHFSDVVTCPGAETCKVAVTASRGVAELVGDRLRARGAGDSAVGADIKVSGCPNGCGQHHIAAIGLQGGVRKVGDQLVPQYHLTIGGGIGPGGATFGRLIGRIPARRIPEAVDRLVASYEARREANETARAYFQRIDVNEAKALVADLTELTEATALPEDFVDLGSTVKFEVVTMESECAT